MITAAIALDICYSWWVASPSWQEERLCNSNGGGALFWAFGESLFMWEMLGFPFFGRDLNQQGLALLSLPRTPISEHFSINM